MAVVEKLETVDLSDSSGYAVLARVVSLLDQRGMRAYLVGGYIRDILLCRAIRSPQHPLRRRAPCGFRTGRKSWRGQT